MNNHPVVIALWLQVPIVFAGVAHMMFVRYQWLAFLAQPVSLRLFGANKTWRGMLVMPMLTAIAALLMPTMQGSMGWQLSYASWFGCGLLAGSGYIFAELPNSWMKRRMGIAPGTLPQRYARLFIMLDQLDSGLGAGIGWWIGLQCSFWVWCSYVVTFPVTALAVKQLLFWVRWKDCAR